MRCQGTKSAIRNDIPVRSSAGALGIVDANSPPSPSAGRLIEVGGIVVDTQATRALKLFLAAATGQRPDVQPIRGS